jgi:hypothetical protein
LYCPRAQATGVRQLLLRPSSLEAKLLNLHVVSMYRVMQCDANRRQTTRRRHVMDPTLRRQRSRVGFLTPNVRAKLPAEAGFVSLVRDDSTTGADRAYKACRSGSA